MSVEVWRPVAEFPQYMVSDLGRVRSHRRGGAPRLFKLKPNNRGYVVAVLCTDDAHHNRTVHRLVAEAFLGAPLPEQTHVRHLDGSRSNNAAANLAWGTPAENEADKKVHGTCYQSNKTHCPRGHAYTAANTRISKDRRYCRQCDVIHKRAWNDKQKAARAASRISTRQQRSAA